MNHKVLLADDSLTIQKVIKITLANQPYDITEASSEDELFHKLKTLKPKVVFLDFNLSEKHTGYELSAKIKAESPSTKILLLLGTFDTVDDASMEKCGASDKIVKPFDSNKFISICRHLVDEFKDDEEIPFPQAKKEAPVAPKQLDEDQWTVSHSTEQTFHAPEPEIEIQIERTAPDLKNPLMKEVTDWGMSVPGIISGPDSGHSMFELPPVIGEIKAAPVAEKKPVRPESEPKYPQSDDLDYPTIEELTPAKEAPKKEQPTSKLISIESFNDRPLELEIEGSYVPDESDVKNIEAQIRDEIEEDLWVADEFEDLKKEVSAKIEEVKSNFQPTRNDFDESLFKPLDDGESITWQDAAEDFKMPEPAPKNESFFQPQTFSSPSPDMNELRSEMEAMVKKYVKEYMDQMFQKNAEKVAWEVIPDLAENLIRQELSKISHKILNDQG